MDDVTLLHGDCLDRMAEIGSASVDAIICDPPYPEIDRPYGRMTEAEWWDLMMGVCREARRILKPSGSAVFILQPNSRKVGSMRGWLFRFQAWACDEWNMVQDHWVWNFTQAPTVHCHRDRGLMRPSVKASVWLGDPDCYRDQASVLWEESSRNVALRNSKRSGVRYSPSGHHGNDARCNRVAEERGGVTPFNLIPFSAGNRWEDGGTHGHSASTLFPLADWWVRYISPEGGVACDPFMGSGTVGLAALNRGRRFLGIERDPGYFATAARRIAEHRSSMPLLAGVSA